MSLLYMLTASTELIATAGEFIYYPPSEKFIYYIGLDYTYNRYSETDRHPKFTITPENDNGIGMLAGFHVRSSLSIQAQFNQLGVFDVDNTGSVGKSSIEAKVYSTGIMGMLHLPLRFYNPYLKLGVHYWEAPERNPGAHNGPVSGSDLLYGCGFMIPIKERIILHLASNYYELYRLKIQSTSLGVMLLL